jgi:hypothetical protein
MSACRLQIDRPLASSSPARVCVLHCIPGGCSGAVIPASVLHLSKGACVFALSVVRVRGAGAAGGLFLTVWCVMMSEPSWGCIALQSTRPAGVDNKAASSLWTNPLFTGIQGKQTTSSCSAPPCFVWLLRVPRRGEAGFRPCLTCDASYASRAPISART